MDNSQLTALRFATDAFAICKHADIIEWVEFTRALWQGHNDTFLVGLADTLIRTLKENDNDLEKAGGVLFGGNEDEVNIACAIASALAERGYRFRPAEPATFQRGTHGSFRRIYESYLYDGVNGRTWGT